MAAVSVSEYQSLELGELGYDEIGIFCPFPLVIDDELCVLEPHTTVSSCKHLRIVVAVANRKNAST